MSRSTLTRDQIIDRAIGLLDEDGLDGLNMRALGKRLESAATAVYWHVGSKDDLAQPGRGLGVARRSRCPDPLAIGWRGAARAMAVELHSRMLTRRTIPGSYTPSVPI